MDYAQRVLNATESATFKYSALAKNPGVINLTIGRPDYDTPEVVKNAAKKALDEGRVHYLPTQGIPELREKIAEKLRKENRIEGIDAARVIVSNGAKMVLYEAVMALVERGDKVAIPNPSWVSYEAMIGLAEGKVVWLPTKAEKGFKPDDEFYAALEESGAKIAVVNSPSNPTGTVYDEKTLKKIADICERKNIFLVSDEPYEKFLYEGKHFSPASEFENTLTVNAFSKSYSMTGWRVGYAACQNKEVISKMNIVQEQSTSGATSFAQYGALGCFTKEAEEHARKMVADFRSRRDHVADLMKKLDAVCVKPEGAFYVFPKFDDVDDIKLAEKFLEEGVGTIPGSPFGGEGVGCLRISYGSANKEKLTQAFERMQKALNE